MQEKVKIIEYGALTSTKGGVESYIIAQVRGIDKNKIKYDFLVPNEPEKLAYEDELKSYGCKIYRSYVRWKNSFFGHYYTLFKFFSQHKGEYDIAIGNYLTLQNLNFLIVAKLFGVKTCIAHSHVAFQDKNNIVYKILTNINKFLAKYFCDYLFACSEAAGYWMFGKKLWHNKKSFVIKNGIEGKKFNFDENIRNEIRKKLNLDNKVVIGHTGRFTIQKNHEFILDVFNEIHKLNKNYILLLIGKGELENTIKEKVKKLKLENNVNFLGERTDVHKLLQAMDIFLFPSKYEGLGISLIEAQAAGLKCFTSSKVIPKEAIITDLVTNISLENTAEFWARIILENYPYERKKQFKNICKKNYDINLNSKYMESLYLKLKNKTL